MEGGSYSKKTRKNHTIHYIVLVFYFNIDDYRVYPVSCKIIQLVNLQTNIPHSNTKDKTGLRICFVSPCIQRQFFPKSQ